RRPAEALVLRSLPLLASLDPVVLIECNCRNLLRLGLCTKICVLRLDLLHLLRRGLLLGASGHIRLPLLLGGYSGSWTCRGLCRGCGRSTRRSLGRASLHPFLLLLSGGRCTSGLLTRNTCFRRCAGGRFLARLAALSCSALCCRCLVGFWRVRTRLGLRSLRLFSALLFLLCW